MNAKNRIDEPEIERDADGRRWRVASTLLIVLALAAAVILQRGTVGAAVAQLGRLSATTVVLLGGLIVVIGAHLSVLPDARERKLLAAAVDLEERAVA